MATSGLSLPTLLRTPLRPSRAHDDSHEPELIEGAHELRTLQG
ncbi:hypothetical protein AAHZ94_17540 [Streptomyces sp. HSW2009]